MDCFAKVVRAQETCSDEHFDGFLAVAIQGSQQGCPALLIYCLQWSPSLEQVCCDQVGLKAGV